MKHLSCVLMLATIWPASVAVGQEKAAQANGNKEDVVMKAMSDELFRSITKLRLADLDKPYFISYRIDDTSSTKISAVLGQLTDEDSARERKLDVDVRVGDFALDNTDFMNMGSENFGGGDCGCHTSLPLDDDYDQIRRQIWLETNSAYKQSAADLAAKRTVLGHRQRGQELADFTPQPPVKENQTPVDLKFEIPALEKLARDLSSAFREAPEITNSGVDIYVMNEFTRFVNSEGASITRSEPVTLLDVRGYTQGSDGQPLVDWFRVYLRNPSQLRSEELLSRTRELIKGLKGLRVAKSIDQYNGPVLFEGEAAADVVGQVFAPAVVASRFPISDQPQFEAQFKQAMTQFGGSLSDRLGARVMPEGFELIDNPTVARLADTDLLGYHTIDNEAVRSREIKIVDNGKLVSLLATRTPTAQTKESTGSDRGMGAAPGSLFLVSRNAITDQELRGELLKAAKQRGYDYGVVVRRAGVGPLSALIRMAFAAGQAEIGGGVAVFKVFADGHEELVRADIGPVPLTAFKEILAAGKTPSVHHGAFVPFASSLLSRGRGRELVVVSYVVPSLLFEEISVKEPTGVAPMPPVLSSPILSRTAISTTKPETSGGPSTSLK